MYRIGNYQFTIEESGNNLFYVDEEKSADDSYIAGICGVTQGEFREVMKKEYNAILYRPTNCLVELVYFKTPEAAKKSLEWIESMILMKKLIAGG